MAYDKGDGKGYQVSKINSCNVNSEVIDGAKKSCLIDTIDLTSQASKNDLKLLFWIDEKAGSIQECTYAENGGQTCTTNPDPTMNKTFEAKVAVRTLANRDAQTVNSGDPVVFTEP